MSTLERSLSWLERVADRANPILVKETRQALKSRQFVVTFMMMLGVSWLIFTIGVIGNGSALEYGAIGSRFFVAFWLVLAVAVAVFVPFSAQRSLLAERDQATYDLLSITTLSPNQIVWGKLLSALVQALIFYSAITPFIAFTSLLQGFDFVFVISLLVLTLLGSMFITMAAIASSTAVKQRQWQAFAVIGGLALIIVLAWSILGTIFWSIADFDPGDPEQWAGLLFILAMGTSYFVLFQKIAAAQLTFESDDRSSGIRIVCSLQFCLLWIGLLALAWMSGGGSLDEEVVASAIILSSVHLAIVGLFVSTEDSFLSRRVRRDLPAGKLRRLIHVPFLQGGARGYLYVLLHVGLLAFLGVATSLAYVATPNWSVAVPLTISAYVVVYLGIATTLARGLQRLSSDIRPGHSRVLMVILFAIGCIAPFVPMLWLHQFGWSYNLLQITNPFWTIAHIANSGEYTGAILIILTVAAATVLLFNLRAIKDGIAEVLLAEVPARKLPAAAPLPEPVVEAAGE